MTQITFIGNIIIKWKFLPELTHEISPRLGATVLRHDLQNKKYIFVFRVPKDRVNSRHNISS